MRRTLQLLLAVTIVTILFTACKKDEISNKDQYQDSYKKFTAFKTSFSNSYHYTAYSGSVFGASASTTIYVVDGKVIGRDYKEYRRSGNGSSDNVLVDGWNESENDIGSHKNGQDALTLDQIYDKAKNVWLKADKKSNDISFEVDANGLIASCGYVPKGCQDDCFIGITITSINGAILDYAPVHH